MLLKVRLSGGEWRQEKMKTDQQGISSAISVTASTNESAVQNPFEPPLEDPRLAAAEPLVDASGEVIRIPLDAQYYRKHFLILLAFASIFTALPIFAMLYGAGGERLPERRFFFAGWYALDAVLLWVSILHYRFQRWPEHFGLRIDSLVVREFGMFQTRRFLWEDISSIFVANGLTTDDDADSVVFRFHNRKFSSLFAGGRYDAALLLKYSQPHLRICGILLRYRKQLRVVGSVSAEGASDV